MSKGIDKATEFRKKLLPNKLYKYYSLDSLCCNKEKNYQKINTLQKNCIWLSSPDYENDPFEYKSLFIDFDKLESLGYQNHKELLEKLNSNIYLSSFSANYSSAMWAYYANNYSGFCVEFDVDRSQATAVKNVCYEEKPIEITNIFSNILNKSKDSKELLYLITEKYCIKDLSWQHEKEYRSLDIDLEKIEELKDNPNSFESRNGMEKPLSDFGLTVSKIIVGYKCDCDYILRLKNIAKILNCNIVMVIPKVTKSNYELTEKPLEENNNVTTD